MDSSLDRQSVYEVLSGKTGVPVDLISRSRDAARDITSCREGLRRVVIGQDEAIGELVRSLRSRQLRGIEDRPAFSGLFVGPSGVGKTELALRLAEVVCGSKNHLVRIDGSEYRESHTVSRLIGAPPGYVGYGQGGQLTEGVRRLRRCVVLFDEVDKSAPEVQNTLLQVMSAGHLTDATGTRVDFRHVFLVLTSNVGNQLANQVARRAVHAEQAEVDYAAQVREAVDESFPIEFLQRLDAIIVFRHLTMEDLSGILDVKLRELAQQVNGVSGIGIADEVRTALLVDAYSPEAGARAMDRVIRESIDPGLLQLAERHQLGRHERRQVHVDVTEAGDLSFSVI